MKISNKQSNPGKGIGAFLGRNSVPLMFIIICAVFIPISGFSFNYLLNEIITRMGRNIFLILSLLIPNSRPTTVKEDSCVCRVL